jgi:hypothetical protein
MSSSYPIYINYPITPTPRFGGGLPKHEQLYAIIAGNRSRYEAELRSYERYTEELTAIPFLFDKANPIQPCWDNDWFGGLDAMALYGRVAATRPARYYEIGSGNSTMFARRAVQDHGCETEIVSIDPFPRAEIDVICDHIVRKPLENASLTLFDRLAAGDILFVDSSHYVFQNSDANIVFLEILPRLKPGVIIHFHDIFLPDDYPAEWSRRYYNEQYLLAAYLLAGGAQPQYKVLFPSYFVSLDTELLKLAEPIFDSMERRPPLTGGSFWLEKMH